MPDETGAQCCPKHLEKGNLSDRCGTRVFDGCMPCCWSCPELEGEEDGGD